MEEKETADHRMLSFSNGVSIEYAKIVCIESNQQRIPFPGGIGEMAHLLDGRPSRLSVQLRDGSTVDINAGSVRLQIHVTD